MQINEGYQTDCSSCHCLNEKDPFISQVQNVSVSDISF